MMCYEDKPEKWRSVYLKRGQRGQLVKAFRNDYSIDVLWRQRIEYDGNCIKVLDQNGDVSRRVYCSDFEFNSLWKLAGSIPLTDSIVEFCGVDNFDRFVFGIMRHVVELFLCGVDDLLLEDIVSLFSDFNSVNFIASDRYKIIGSHGDFDGLEGNIAEVVKWDDDAIDIRILVNGAEFSINLDNRDILTSFIISSIPV